MNFSDVIKNRYSSRSYKSDAVEKEKLDVILEAALIAPTACNKQPFKIAVINTKGHEKELKKIYNKDWFVEAPLVLGIIGLPDKSWIRADKKNYYEVDAAIIADHITLAATDLGLGTCWIANFNSDSAKEFLNLADNEESIIFISLGYSKDIPMKKTRKTLEELVIDI
jgi:nitroreductase